MKRFFRWLKRQGVEENPFLILKLGGLLVLAIGLTILDIFPQVMVVLSGLLCLGMFLLVILTLLLFSLRGVAEYDAAMRGAAAEEADPDHDDGDALPVFKVPGEPGRRTWAHDVYDENAYAILGVAQNATRGQIRVAFRKLVQKHHPDAAPPEEKERASLVFARIDQAFELLSHVENRARYDAWINHLHGREPALDDACALFRNSQAVAQFDAEIMSRLPAAKRPSANQSMPDEVNDRGPMTYSFAPAEQTDVVPSGPGDSPPEVDVPDAVREALGLAAAAPSTCVRCGKPKRESAPENAAFCRECGEMAGSSPGIHLPEPG